jgi:hypothetical protein
VKGTTDDKEGMMVESKEMVAESVEEGMGGAREKLNL